MDLITGPFIMIRDIGRASTPIYIWGAALNFPQIFGVVFFYEQPLSIWISLTCVLTLIIAGRIHRRMPLSRLTSLCHILWLPLAPMIVVDLQAVSLASAYGIWLCYVTGTMAISLVFDIRNVFLFIREGDETIHG